jgi:hypothetical protein
MMQVIEAGLVPYVQSSPGMGKSCITRNVADEFKLFMIDHRLSTSAPEDLSGLPRFNEKGEAHFSPFVDLFPLDDRTIPDGKQGWMLFLDEFNAASKSVQAAAYKLILDRMIGQRKLHPCVAIVAAGNMATDRAIVNPLSTAMQSRLVHLEMVVSFDEWLADVALKENYDNRIIAYLSMYHERLMDFRPEHQEKTFCCPRTWEFVNRLIKDKTVDDESAILLAGTITSGTAADFTQFTKVFEDLISLSEILRDPLTCRMPDNASSKWAVITHMMSNITEKNFADLGVYADRFTLDFRILFYRSVLVRKPELRMHSSFSKAMSTLSRYLHG